MSVRIDHRRIVVSHTDLNPAYRTVYRFTGSPPTEAFTGSPVTGLWRAYLRPP